VSHESEKHDWIHRRSPHRIWLKELKPFVFCGSYRKRNQVQNRGEYEIYFVNRTGMFSASPIYYSVLHHTEWHIDADRFEDLFREDSDVNDEGDAMGGGH
jgi:hypothetical protein